MYVPLLKKQKQKKKNLETQRKFDAKNLEEKNKKNLENVFRLGHE